MKTLKIVTHWAAGEAGCICQLPGDLKSAVWENYGENILKMHEGIRAEQDNNKESIEFNDELPFQRLIRCSERTGAINPLFPGIDSAANNSGY